MATPISTYMYIIYVHVRSVLIGEWTVSHGSVWNTTYFTSKGPYFHEPKARGGSRKFEREALLPVQSHPL